MGQFDKFSIGLVIVVISLIITVGNVESVSADSVKFDQLDHIIVDHSDIISFIDNTSPFEAGSVSVTLDTPDANPPKTFTLYQVSGSNPSLFRTVVKFSTGCTYPCLPNELKISAIPGETVTLSRLGVTSDTVTTKAAVGPPANPQYGNNVAPLSAESANCAQYGGDSEVNAGGVGDGICDGWESGGNLVISHLGGTYSPSGGTMLQLRNPSSSQLDVYVEIDYMQGHRPNVEALWEVIKGFESMGITLHIQLDDEGSTGDLIPHAATTRWPGSNSFKGFQQISTTHFGTCAERRTDANCAAIPSTDWNSTSNTGNWKRKAQVFHYGLFAHAPTTGSSTGIGEIGGNDFMITLGVLNNVNELVPPGYIEGTLMHELGHNLNLSHGGAYGDPKNCKPTHMSVMSYSRQLTDLVPNRNLEY